MSIVFYCWFIRTPKRFHMAFQKCFPWSYSSALLSHFSSRWKLPLHYSLLTLCITLMPPIILPPLKSFFIFPINSLFLVSRKLLKIKYKFKDSLFYLDYEQTFSVKIYMRWIQRQYIVFLRIRKWYTSKRWEERHETVALTLESGASIRNWKENLGVLC